MTTSVIDEPEVLAQAREAGQAAALPFAGSVAPRDAWALVQAGRAVLVDVRSAEAQNPYQSI